MMKRLLLPAVLAVASTVAFAQAPVERQSAPAQDAVAGHHGHHAHNPQKMAAHLSKKLNLTPDQTARLEPVLAAREQKVAALRSDASLTPDARKAQMRSIHEDTFTQLGSILTPDQLQQMKAMHHEHGRHGHHGDTPYGTPAA